jgi:hypothetical protein
VRRLSGVLRHAPARPAFAPALPAGFRYRQGLPTRGPQRRERRGCSPREHAPVAGRQRQLPGPGEPLASRAHQAPARLPVPAASPAWAGAARPWVRRRAGRASPRAGPPARPAVPGDDASRQRSGRRRQLGTARRRLPLARRRQPGHRGSAGHSGLAAERRGDRPPAPAGAAGCRPGHVSQRLGRARASGRRPVKAGEPERRRVRRRAVAEALSAVAAGRAGGRRAGPETLRHRRRPGPRPGEAFPERAAAGARGRTGLPWPSPWSNRRATPGEAADRPDLDAGDVSGPGGGWAESAGHRQLLPARAAPPTAGRQGYSSR